MEREINKLIKKTADHIVEVSQHVKGTLHPDPDLKHQHNDICTLVNTISKRFEWQKTSVWASRNRLETTVFNCLQKIETDMLKLVPPGATPEDRFNSSYPVDIERFIEYLYDYVYYLTALEESFPVLRKYNNMLQRQKDRIDFSVASFRARLSKEEIWTLIIQVNSMIEDFERKLKLAKSLVDSDLSE